MNVKDFSPKFPILGVANIPPSAAANQGFGNYSEINHSPNSFSINPSSNDISVIKANNKENAHYSKTPTSRGGLNDMPVQYSYLIKTLNKEKTLQMKI